MYAGQTLVANDGYEVMLFPLPKLGVTQGEHPVGTTQYAIDFGHWGSGRNPYYAPCTCISLGCKTSHSGSLVGYDHVVWKSKYMVHTPSGLAYLTWQVGHDDDCDANFMPAGTELAQGDLMGHTGTKQYGIVGRVADHLHFQVCLGSTMDYDHGVHMYNYLYVNGTEVNPSATGGYDWKTWTEPTPTTYTVTLVPSPTGGGTVVGGGIYNAGSSVTVRAIANPDYLFDHWSNGNTNSQFTFTVQGDTYLTAYFRKRPSGDLVMINYDGTNLYIF